MPVLMVSRSHIVKEETGELDPQSNLGQVFEIQAQGECRPSKEVVARRFSCNRFSLDILPEKPVYVLVQNDQENLMYSSSRMELDKLYEIEWMGENYALRKTKESVEFFKFYPDEDGD